MRSTIRAIAAAAIIAATTTMSTLALDNGLARTPQMGWNSWNKFGCNVNETLIQQTADAMVSTGLAKLGYEYVNVDDCWQESRDSRGRIIADQKTFPSGMGKLSSYVHSRGLKFGLYSDAGTETCQGRPGSLGFEEMDAISYAMFEVDYLKYDNCHNNGIPAQQRYPPMRDALNHTGRPILYSICEWGESTPYLWAPEVGNSWRTTGDIVDTWGSMLFNIDANDVGWKAAGPGAYNDPDMLEVGNGGMSNTEYTTHFSLWALAKSPLIIGCDVRNIDAETLAILSNAEVIAINQDVLGVQGHKILPDAFGVELWGGPLNGTSFVALMVNRGTVDAPYSFDFSALGAPACNNVRDLWAHKDLGQIQGKFSTPSVTAHGVQMLKLTPCDAHPQHEHHNEQQRIALE